MSKLHKLCAPLLLAGLLPFASSAVAQNYPETVVKLVVPTGPGTASDATARFLAEGLSKKFGKAFIVENRPGASGTIATAAVHRSAPDGHTLLLTFATHYINQWSLKTDYDARDFTPLAQLNSSPIVMSVGVDSPYKTVEDVVKAAKADPGKLTMASMGGVSQIAGTYFLEEAKIDVESVLYKDPPQVLLDTANGLADIAFTGLTAPLPFVSSGKMRILGISAPKRDPHFPDIPTISESNLPDYALVSQTMLLAPKGLPEDITKKLSDALGDIVQSEEFAQLCKTQACGVEYLDHKALQEKFPSELEKWKKLVELAGLTRK